MAEKNKIWFTSDVHLSHVTQLYFHPARREAAGISFNDLRTLTKPELIERYDNWFIGLWNSIVRREDCIYHLGDFCLGNKERTEYILNRLHGKKYFIRGNHDKSLGGNERFLEGIWDIKEAKFTHEQFPFIKEGEPFCVEMCHYPMVAWNRRPHGTCHIHGHTHGATDEFNRKSEELRVDVGFDGELADYGFVSLEKLYDYFYTIVHNAGCDSFQEYAEWLMAKQGFRM